MRDKAQSDQSYSAADSHMFLPTDGLDDQNAPLCVVREDLVREWAQAKGFDVADVLTWTRRLSRDDGSCSDCTAKAYPDQYERCEHCAAECGHGYCAPCSAASDGERHDS